MADNFQITQGSGTTIAAHDNGVSLEQQVQVTNFPATVEVSNDSGNPVPINGTVTANAGTGNFTVAQATGSNLHVVVDTAPTTAVTGTFFQATQPISGTVSATQGTNPWTIVQTSNNLLVSATGAAAAAVTATLPAVALSFHYIGLIEVVKIFTAANAASATPLVITTTNLPGPLNLSFGQPLGTIGTELSKIHVPNSPLKSSVANTNTTIVCPATAGIIWRVNVYYYAAA